MRIAIKNNKNVDHKIRRFNGIIDTIPAKSYKILVLGLQNEINYWSSVKDSELSKYGLTLYKDPGVVNKIDKILRGNVCNNVEPIKQFVETSIFDNPVSPIAQSIMSADKLNNKDNLDDIDECETVSNDETVDEVVENVDDVTTDDSTDVPKESSLTDSNDLIYTEDELNKLTKVQLQSILTDRGISFRKNSSNATLIKLILG